MSSNIIVKRICEHCKNEFNAKTTTTRFCSHKCNSRNYKKQVREHKLKHVLEDFKEKKLTSTPEINSIDVKPFLTIKETCVLLGASDSTIRKLIKNNTIKTFQTGGKHLIRRIDLDSLFTTAFKN